MFLSSVPEKWGGGCFFLYYIFNNEYLLYFKIILIRGNKYNNLEPIIFLDYIQLL